jgi:hypothetical protein
MSYDGDMRKVIKRAVSQGWRYEKTKRDHHKFYAPDMVSIVVASGTTCNNTGWREFISEMRKAGYKEHDDMEQGNGVTTTTLGDAIQKAITGGSQPATLRKDMQQTSVRDSVRGLLLEEPDRAYAIEEVYLLLHGRGHSNVSRANVGAMLHQLFEKGEITKLEVGTYRFNNHEASTSKLLSHAHQKDNGTAEYTFSEEGIDPDEKAIDDAIAVLVRMKETLRAQKAFEQRKVALKKLLEEEG